MEGSGMRSGSRPSLRAGGTALTLLSSSLNLEVLRTLAEGPQPLQELMHRLGFPPRSTMRLYLRTLEQFGTVERKSRNEFPTSVDYGIRPGGEALLELAEILQAWISHSPAGSTELGSTAARSAIKALVEGWGSNVVRALATRPLSLTELNGLIPRISYPSLERRLTAMRQVNLLEVQRTSGRSSPYEVTDWLRMAVAPVTAAIGWERRYAADATPDLRRLDVETAFLLAAPLMHLGEGVNGSCRLAVEVHDGVSPLFAGVIVFVEKGEVTSCLPSLDGEAEAWISGDLPAWVGRMNGASVGELEIGGDKQIAQPLMDALRRTATEPQ
ncbi:MAG: winged helix-turn-helix transcriptional regulator [Solirubrobacterales bacterium]